VPRAEARRGNRVVRRDGLRKRLGDELALELLASTGENTAQIKAKWQAERQRQESTTRQVTTHYGDLDDDPRHDPRVTDAIMRGASNDELRQIISQVTAEYAHRIKAEAAQAARRKDFMWVNQHGVPQYAGEVPLPLGAAHGPDGSPVQKTLSVDKSVPPLGSESITAPYMGDVRVVATTCTEHAGQAGDRYCSTCGRLRPA
jgi:hypothetical protein